MRSSQSDAQGFVLAVLLIVMAVTATWMTVALPTWKQRSIREKEAELVFRGQQYQRAMRLYNQKFPGATPQNLDILVDNKVIPQPLAWSQVKGAFERTAPLVRQAYDRLGSKPAAAEFLRTDAADLRGRPVWDMQQWAERS